MAAAARGAGHQLTGLKRDMNDWGLSLGMDAVAATSGGVEVDIELVGPHLRVGGRISLGRFSRLSDRINHGRGFILLHDARLLKRNGDATPLVVEELYVNQDEVTFVALTHAAPAGPSGPVNDPDRPLIQKLPRRHIVFTPGHVISGLIHVHSEMNTASLVDSTDPRFIPMTHVSARSLADRRVISHFDLLLINRTQMTAVAEAGTGGPAGSEAETEAPAVEIG